MACGFLRELPSQGPALPGYYPFFANPILPISYQSYPLPAGPQFTRGKTQMGITRVRPIWVTTVLGGREVNLLASLRTPAGEFGKRLAGPLGGQNLIKN